ncbi:serine/threonine protein kinase [Aeromicrobium sp. Marseille-Q0843]|uniref:Serine/threonine protein kinase n=1 Tax=Aeromicrobium phoceense TaxID=2754045 RepID=A0A838XK27_9ACTN|nr:serine/threonine protein kinase [Aeromicrobium phoceense]MBA4609351.1 serine/threonine protein kinase [Aeromicrobium phoceense]
MPQSSRPARIAATLAAAVTAAALIPSAAATGAASASPDSLRDVMFVGNNWAGTASIVDAHDPKILRSGINLIPDKAQELRDINRNPLRLITFTAVRVGPGQGHDQFVDDMFSTKDGRYLAVSRPSFADVVWIDIAKAVAGDSDSIVAEQPMDGYRSDHAGLSPDGKRLLVSDSVERQVIEFAMVDQTLPDGRSVKMGDRLRTFESGDTPHENNYSADGQRIFHASIGSAYTALDGPLGDWTKGDRWFEIVRNDDFGIDKRWDMGKELAEAGHPKMSSAVRPMAIAPGERFVYFQVSYFHGYVEFDTMAADINGKADYSTGKIAEPRTGAVTRLIPLPNRVPKIPITEYVNDSAHHGLSIDKDGTTLCVAGTMDDYAALVDRATGAPTLFDTATTGHSYLKPYWTTEGLNDTCWISLSDSDSVAVLDVRTKKEIAYLPVGDHPQRVRLGTVERGLFG